MLDMEDDTKAKQNMYGALLEVFSAKYGDDGVKLTAVCASRAHAASSSPQYIGWGRASCACAPGSARKVRQRTARRAARPRAAARA